MDVLQNGQVLVWLVASLAASWLVAVLLFWALHNVWPRSGPSAGARWSIALAMLLWAAFMIFLCPPVRALHASWTEAGRTTQDLCIGMSPFAAIAALVILLAALIRPPALTAYRHPSLPA